MSGICPNPNLGPNDLCTKETCCIQLYGSVSYYPSLPGNILYLIIFAILLFAQIGLGTSKKTWGFLAGMTVYLICLTIAPAFITASLYLTLGRIIPVYGHRFSRFQPRTYTILFVINDFISLLLQAAGGAITSIADGGSSLQQTGINIMIAGLAYQVASLGSFMLLCCDFAFSVWRAHRKGAAFSPHFAHVRTSSRFKLFLCALTLAVITIFIRCCYRVAELKEGFSGSIANNEALFMVFEGPMIFIAVGALTLFHPGIAFAGQWQEANFSLRGRKVPKGTEGVKLDSTDGFALDHDGVTGKHGAALASSTPA